MGFDIEKTEAMLFTKATKRTLTKTIDGVKIKIGNEMIKFHTEAMRWLGVLLDPRLDMRAHFSLRIEKAKNVLARVKGITGLFGLSPSLTRRVHVAAVHSTMLYGAELWWREGERGQEGRQKKIQQVLNTSARATTGMWKSTPIEILSAEAGIAPARVTLTRRQQRFSARLANLPRSNPARSVLPVTFRDGDGDAQPEELPDDDISWSDSRTKGKENLGQYLARSLSTTATVDPAVGIEPIEDILPTTFPGVVVIDPPLQALEQAKMPLVRGVWWVDRSKIDDGRVGAAAVSLDPTSAKWQILKNAIGTNQEVFDAELWGVNLALNEALKNRASRNRLNNSKLTIFVDSQNAIRRIAEQSDLAGQSIARVVHEKAQKLTSENVEVWIRWVPAHSGVEGNERADKAAKEAAKTGKVSFRYSSLTYIKQSILIAADSKRKKWVEEALRRKETKSGVQYSLTKSLPTTLATSRKSLAARFLQLKSGHAATASFLCRIGVREDEKY